MNLKCGGTLRERADRLWSVRGKKWEDIPSKLKTSANPPSESDGHGAGEAADEQTLKWKEVRARDRTVTVCHYCGRRLRGRKPSSSLSAT